MSKNYSALWSSLRTLETNQFTSTFVGPAKGYSTFFGSIEDKKHHMRHQKLASGLAHIGATSSDAKTVTACSVEVTYSEGTNGPVIILRMAQNKQVDEEEKSRLQSLVNDLVTEISAQERRVWDIKDDRFATIRSIIRRVVLPRTVQRCRDKISHILIGPYSRPFREWYANIDKSNPLEDTAGPPDPRLLQGLQVINSCSGDDVSILWDSSDVDAIVSSIVHASAIIAKYGDILESRWAVYSSKVHYDKVAADTLQGHANEEDLVSDQVSEDDDRESLDPAEMKMSSIYRFFRKLERYYVACRVVTSELVHLVRSGDAERNVTLDITVETVPILTTTSTPLEQNEYPTCEDFFMERFQIDVNTLDRKKLGSLCSSWPKGRKSNNLFLHAEMQMALYYALNPQLCPIQGFIGVSKKCCWCCDFVLKHLQTSGEEDERYKEDVAGPPILFTVNETHNRKYTAWVFPDPSKHIGRHCLKRAVFDRICNRFKLVREDLEMALVSEVKTIIRELQKPEYASDSSGMDDDCDDRSDLWDEEVDSRKGEDPDEDK